MALPATCTATASVRDAARAEVESKAALANLDAILVVEGVDAVFNVYESLLMAPPSDAPVIVKLLDNPQVQAQGQVREVTPTVSADSGTVQIKQGEDDDSITVSVIEIC